MGQDAAVGMPAEIGRPAGHLGGLAAQRALYAIAGAQAARTRAPVIVADAREDPRFAGSESVVDLQLRSVLCVPAPGTVWLSRAGADALDAKVGDTIGIGMSELRLAALVGDLATDQDARRLQRAGLPAVQITTGQACHLEAAMVHRGLEALAEAGRSVAGDVSIVSFDNDNDDP